MVEEVKKAYLDYLEHYTKRNWDQMLQHFSKSISTIGTGVDEFSQCYEQTIMLFGREFSQCNEIIQYQIRAFHVFPLNDELAYITALIDMVFTIPNGEPFEYNGNRTTAILKKEDEQWKIIHGHWSQPAFDQGEGESIPLSVLMAQNEKLKCAILKKQKELELQNIQLIQMNDLKDRLFSIVSHDLKSPFNAFLGITNLMLSHFEANYADKEHFHLRLRLINENAHSLYDLTENLLNWANINLNSITPNLRETSVDEIIQKQIDLLRPQCSKKSIRINQHLSNGLTIKTDPDLIAIVVRNIIVNAIKFSHENGIISIKANIRNGCLQIVIADNGVGMSNQQLNRLFVGYNTTWGTHDEKGSGLGLITSKGLLEKLHGEIHVKSAVGKGSVFSILIPA